MPSVTFTIDDMFYTEYKPKILAAFPVETDIAGQPVMTDDQWIKELVRRDIVGRFKTARDRWNAKQPIGDVVT